MSKEMRSRDNEQNNFEALELNALFNSMHETTKAELLRGVKWEIQVIAQTLKISEEKLAQYLLSWTLDENLTSKHKGALKTLNTSESQSLEQHVTENAYTCVLDICDYVERTYGVRYTILKMTEWLQAHDFSFQQATLQQKSTKNVHPALLDSTLSTVVRESYLKKLAEFYHEINQPLTAIVCYSRSCLYVLKNKLEYTQLMNKLLLPLENIVLQASQAANMINHMRHELNHSTMPVEAADINLLIKETLPLLDHALVDFKLKITLNLMSDPPKLLINKTNIMHVILNLAKHSIASLQSGAIVQPELIIETHHVGDHLVVKFIDNGPGTVGALTTTSPSSGIDLRMCKSLIEAHDGTMRLNQDKKAWVSFTLPINRASI